MQSPQAPSFQHSHYPRVLHTQNFSFSSVLVHIQGLSFMDSFSVKNQLLQGVR